MNENGKDWNDYKSNQKSPTGLKNRRRNPNWKGGDIRYVCRWCKKIFGVRRDRSTSQKGYYCSTKCYQKKIASNKMSVKQKHTAKTNIKNLLRWLRFNTPLKIDWLSRFGYTPEQFKIHVESLFKKGMCWDNYGEWELDHVRPIHTFRFESTSDEEFRECFSLKNLQPLWKKENLAKGKKYE